MPSYLLRFTFILSFFFAALFLPTGANAQTLLVDTGAGGTSSIGAYDLFGTDNTTCSPQPDCLGYFNFIAGQFTLTHAASLDSVQGWMGPFGSGGQVNVIIYPDNKGFPGVLTPIYSQTFTLGTQFNAGWVVFTFAQPNPDFPAGTYWLAFEPVAGTGFNYNMPPGAPTPLAKYAYSTNGNPGYEPFALNVGMRVSGTTFPDLAYGTAGRAEMAGSSFGFPFSDDNTVGGVNQVTVAVGSGEIPAGWSIIRASLFSNSLSTGAWSGTSVCIESFGGCTQASGSARSLAFRSFTNTTDSSITFSANAVLDGSFSTFGGATASATANVYVFDATSFSNTLASAGANSAQFLLNSVPFSQSLASLFPPDSLLASTSQTLTGPQDQLLTAPLATGLLTLASQQSITVMFDATVNTPAGNVANFFSTLAPATVFFTDQLGNPVTQILAVGPATPAPATPANLVLSPSTSTSPIGSTATITATATDSTNTPIQNAVVYFTVATGPNAGSPTPYTTDVNGTATFSYNDAGGAGTDSIQANIDSLQSNTVTLVWTSPGPLDHITISPSNGTIAPGGSQIYTAQGFDVFNNSLGDVSASTQFSISPDGSCTGSSCTATVSGPHTVTGTDNGKSAQASLTVSASQATPAITWATPVAITYGTLLSGTQLNATANTQGTFSYTPPAGTLLTAGSQTLSVKFTPNDSTDFTTATATVSLTVNRATPVITWPTPAPINAGTPLSSTQLNATANVQGGLIYTPGTGTVLPAGNQTLSGAFTPSDPTDYNNASAQVTLVVNSSGKTTPVIKWPAPASITYGTSLSKTQLDATANVSGTFAYTPASGTILKAGLNTLSVKFTPSNTSAYNTSTATVALQVNQAKPVVVWIPIPTTYGTPLGGLQLDAVAFAPGTSNFVSGTFAYAPAAGTVLGAGNRVLTATFTPKDNVDFAVVNAQTTLTVLKATPVITWRQPASITYGTPLSATQLNATANTQGKFTYSPGAGTVLRPGNYVLTATFTPNDGADYQSARAQVNLTVKSH